MANIYLTLFVILILAYLATLLCRKIGIPRVVGQMSVGILILAVPFLSGALIDTDTLGALGIFANIGIVLLFFFVGLEINFREFKKSFKNSEIISLLHTIVPLSMGFLVSYYIFGFDVAASLVIGIALAVSAEGIAVDFLQEANQLKKPLGKLVITIGALDDMNQFALLTIFFLFIGTAGGISLESLLIGVVLLIIAMVAVKMALEKSTVLYKKHRSEATLFMGALIIIFLFGYLTDSIGIGASIGALVAGMLVRQSLLTGKIRNVWEEHEIVRMVNTVAFGLFVPLFFVCTSEQL
jgi:Kef-type K+ transport system membrane component KefB